jgi:hypothetical protein
MVSEKIVDVIPMLQRAAEMTERSGHEVTSIDQRF